MTDSGNVLVLLGASALSRFRKKAIIDRIQCGDTRVLDVHAGYQYFVHLDSSLTDRERSILEQLLDVTTSEGGEQSNELLVTPRIGTISPWSTKATNIIHRCGLNQVKRVERGVTWRFGLESSSKSDELSKIASMLHDPMTESVLHDSSDLARLFQPASPMPLVCVDVMQGGRQALEQANSEFGFALSDDEIDYSTLR